MPRKIVRTATKKAQARRPAPSPQRAGAGSDTATAPPPARLGRVPLGGLNARERAWFASAVRTQSPAEAGIEGGGTIVGRFSARQARDLIFQGLGAKVTIETARQEMFALGLTRHVTFQSRFSGAFDEAKKSLGDWPDSAAAKAQEKRDRDYVRNLTVAVTNRRRGPVPLNLREYHALKNRFLIEDELLPRRVEFARYLERIADES